MCQNLTEEQGENVRGAMGSSVREAITSLYPVVSKPTFPLLLALLLSLARDPRLPHGPDACPSRRQARLQCVMCWSRPFKSSRPTALTNKVLLEPSHARSVGTIMAALALPVLLRSCSRDRVAPEPNLFTVGPFTEHLCRPLCLSHLCWLDVSLLEEKNQDSPDSRPVSFTPGYRSSRF